MTNPANLSVARARQSAARRHSRRRVTTTVSDPLHLLAVVVPPSKHSKSKLLCPLCTSTFGRRCELKRHIAEVHTLAGARRFVCKHPNCTKSFTRKDALAKHEIVKHQGKRRFQCDTCGEKFTSRYDLRRHKVRVHSNVKKRFTCEFCSAGFSQKSQLTMHKGRVHVLSETPPQTPVSITLDPTTESCSSFDSLAAVAVAIKQEEENRARCLELANSNYSITNRSPFQTQRAATEHSVAKRTTPKEEADAATHAANTILQAAKALQPMD